MPRRLLGSVLLLAACSSGGQRVDDPLAVGTVPMPAFAVSSQPMAMELQAPWSLTASDGSGLVLTRVDAKAVFEGPLAFTELHLYFHNPEDRVREGTFAINLPPRAAVSRFAMENNGQWMEAEVVEKQRARRVYEDFLHRRQDPALLEKADGNQFTARVFPIPAKGDKHLVLSFSQELPGERYVLPLRGLPKTERVDIRLSTLGTDGRKVDQLLSERNWQPDRDFVSTAAISAEALGAGSLVAAQVEVGDPAASVDAPKAMTLLVDTSASRTLGFGRSVATLGTLIRQLGKQHPELRLQVLAFDQETKPIFDGAATGWGKAHEDALLARGAAGASDLGQAIAYLNEHAPHARIVVFGDAVVTAGAKPDAIVSGLRQLRGVERVDVVLSGGLRDDELATQLARSSARAGAVLDADAGVEGVAQALGQKMLTDLVVDVRGASWVFPRSIASARPGSRVMVYARLPARAQALDIGIAGRRHTMGLARGTDALVERAVAAAEIHELEAKLPHVAPDAAPALRAEIAKRSIAARVISSQTSMLVLESLADYERYGIDRTSLADILEVGPDGAIVQKHRSLQIADQPAQPRKQPATKDTWDSADKNKKQEIGNLSPVDERPEPTLAQDLEAKEDEAEDKAEKSIAMDPGASAGSAAGPAVDRPPPAAPPPPPAAEPARRRPATTVAREARGGDAIASEESDGHGGGGGQAWPPRDAPAPLQGELAAIAKAIGKRDLQGALGIAKAWREREPGNVLALVGLGETLEAGKDLAGAARAYGSIIDLFPGRADLRRFAGQRLERIGQQARALAVDTYERAVADRPDHMTGHRLLAYALLRSGKHAEAFAAILAGLSQQYPGGRFAGGERVLGDDAGMIGAAYAAAMPGKRGEIEAALAKHGLKLATAPSTRFILYWETDANDVDFHIQDGRGGHAFYGNPRLPSGGELYADITTGYGPECFAIPGNAKAGPYRLSIDYYSQGPMGYGMGLLQIVKHDGKGTLAFEDRPYIIMADHAYVDLGTYK